MIIDTKYLAVLAEGLENQEFGAAMRLFNHIIVTGRPAALKRARAICQMTPDHWGISSCEILARFVVSGEEITHAAILEAALPPVATVSKVRLGATPDMPIVYPTKDHQVPFYGHRDRPELISMKKTAYIMMSEIFIRSDQNTNSARALLASLLKNWPEGDVYEAVSAADKQTFLVNPRSWIIKHLQTNSRPIVAARSSREACPAPMPTARRNLVTPELTGVSTKTADKIRDRNAALRLDLDVKRPTA